MNLIARIRSAFADWLRRWRWNRLVAKARNYEMSPEEREAQRRNFAYGNVKLSNPDVTMEMVNEAADKLQKEREGK